MTDIIYASFDDKGERGHIKNMVEQCMPTMLPREFTINGIEAGAHNIHWGKSRGNIYVSDDGEGIPLKFLQNMMYFAIVTDKAKGRGGNKGIGARITGLYNSPLGVVYETCRPDEGSHMTEIRRFADGFYGAVSHDGQTVRRSKHKSPGTKATFKGGASKQIGFDITKAGAIPKELFERFYRLPKGVNITFDRGLVSGKNGNRLITITQHIKSKPWKRETVEMEDGLKITFVDSRGWTRGDKTKGKRSDVPVGAVNSARAMSAVVYRDEMFCLGSYSNEKRAFMRSIGLSEISDELMVFIELPKSYGVTMNEDRTQLMWDRACDYRKVRTANTKVEPKHFHEDVKAALPEWVKDMLEEKRSRADRKALEAAKQELRDAIKAMFDPQDIPTVDDDGDIEGDVDENATVDDFDDGDKDEVIDPSPDHDKRIVTPRERGPSRARMLKELLANLDIILCDDPNTLCAIDGYQVLVSEHHRFFVNMVAMICAQYDLEEARVRSVFHEKLKAAIYLPVGLAAVDAIDMMRLEPDADYSHIPIGAYYTAADAAAKEAIVELTKD